MLPSFLLGQRVLRDTVAHLADRRILVEVVRPLRRLDFVQPSLGLLTQQLPLLRLVPGFTRRAFLCKITPHGKSSLA